MELSYMLAATLVFSGVVLIVSTTVAYSSFGRRRSIATGKRHAIARWKYGTTTLGNALLSPLLVFGLLRLSEAQLFHARPAPAWALVLECTAILFVYDLLYYLLHRYAFHEWRFLRRVHAVHHAIRNPIALDSLYLHPVENALGLGTLWLAALLVRLVAGPIAAGSFAAAFAVFALLNVVVHSGLALRLPLVDLLAARHTRHHASMRARNYASLTPVFDRAFGTEEAPRP